MMMLVFPPGTASGREQQPSLPPYLRVNQFLNGADSLPLSTRLQISGTKPGGYVQPAQLLFLAEADGCLAVLPHCMVIKMQPEPGSKDKADLRQPGQDFCIVSAPQELPLRGMECCRQGHGFVSTC